MLRPELPFSGRVSPHASCPRNYKRYRNMNRFPIDYDLRPRLRGRLTPGRLPLPGKPKIFGGEGSHLPFRYLYLHSLFHLLQHLSRVRLHQLMECSPTALYNNCIRPVASVYCLAPLHYLRMNTRPVSCYALFKGIAASKPTSWLSRYSHFILHSSSIWGP